MGAGRHRGNVNLRPLPEQVMAGAQAGLSEPRLSVRGKKRMKKYGSLVAGTNP